MTRLRPSIEDKASGSKGGSPREAQSAKWGEASAGKADRESSASKRPSSFRELYESVAVPRLRDELKRSNPNALPRIRAVVVAIGVGKHRAEGKFLEDATHGLTLLAGQKPASRPARISIAGFKLRAGQPVGLVVTLRRRRMEDFLARLLWVALPRVRDFRGIPFRAVDAGGNLTIGFRDASAFPEVDPGRIETPFGLQVTIVTSARNQQEGLALFRALGFPLTESERETVRGKQKRRGRLETPH